jgi:hypothetical protein
MRWGLRSGRNGGGWVTLREIPRTHCEGRAQLRDGAVLRPARCLVPRLRDHRAELEAERAILAVPGRYRAVVMAEDVARTDDGHRLSAEARATCCGCCPSGVFARRQEALAWLHDRLSA